MRIHDELDLDSHEYMFKVRGSEVARGRIMAGHHLAMDPGDAVGKLDGIPTTEPAFGLPAIWVAESQHAEAEALGYTVVDGESVIVTHLTETIRSARRVSCSRARTCAQLLDQLKESNEAVVNEVVPDVLSLGEIQRVLQALLARGRLDPRSRRDRRGGRRQGALDTRSESAGRVRAPGAGPVDHRARTSMPNRTPARDHARSDDRA